MTSSATSSGTYGPLQDQADEVGYVGGTVRHATVRQLFEVAEVPYRLVDQWSHGGRTLTVYEFRLDATGWIAEFNLIPHNDSRWVGFIFSEKPSRPEIKKAYWLERAYGKRVYDW